MKMCSQHKMRNCKSGRGKRGFSSVVGAIFMVLIVTVLASTYFVYTLSENTAYNTAVGQKNQLDQSVKSEYIQCGNTTYTCYKYPDTNVNVRANVTNTGSVSVQFIRLWLCASNYTSDSIPWTGYKFISLTNVNIQPGQTYLLNNGNGINLTVSGFISTYNSSYTYASWLVTSRGNTVALQTQIASSNVVISAMVAQGIGAISMELNSFKYYDVSQVGGKYVLSNYPNGGFSGYSVPRTSYVAFAVNLTNYDLKGRDVSFTSGSILWVIFPVTGTQPRCAGWYIVDIYDNGTVKPTLSTIHLNYLESKTIIFASKQDVAAGFVLSSAQDWWNGNQGPSATNLLLVGTIGAGAAFGQNVPFVSIFFT